MSSEALRTIATGVTETNERAVLTDDVAPAPLPPDTSARSWLQPGWLRARLKATMSTSETEVEILGVLVSTS